MQAFAYQLRKDLLKLRKNLKLTYLSRLGIIYSRLQIKDFEGSRVVDLES